LSWRAALTGRAILLYASERPRLIDDFPEPKHEIGLFDPDLELEVAAKYVPETMNEHIVAISSSASYLELCQTVRDKDIVRVYLASEYESNSWLRPVMQTARSAYRKSSLASSKKS